MKMFLKIHPRSLLTGPFKSNLKKIPDFIYKWAQNKQYHEKKKSTRFHTNWHIIEFLSQIQTLKKEPPYTTGKYFLVAFYFYYHWRKDRVGEYFSMKRVKTQDRMLGCIQD